MNPKEIEKKGGKEMGKQTNFMMTKRTSIIYPEYTEDGELHAKVMENNILHSVALTPTRIIDLNLRFHGSSLRGAYDGSRTILDGPDLTMLPIIINEKLSMYWFPSKSPYKEDCVWFGLLSIKSYHRFREKQTRVVFENGALFILDSSYSSFDEKYKRACKLKTANDRRTDLLMVCETAESAEYLISLDREKRNYFVEE
ncbi:competence transcription regulator (CTF) [Sporosarcina newyorkensis 2681]|uniref:Competence transcription regulator (CTF) n=2 Tax=Sporosarcina newyorkensis TaxID=759851 RepID=F9DQW8_9BACL|nr:competence transcription regulator (CTF) [Sporosarcina newyorkensis 2681]